jgi:hypothetical protein
LPMRNLRSSNTCRSAVSPPARRVVASNPGQVRARRACRVRRGGASASVPAAGASAPPGAPCAGYCLPIPGTPGRTSERPGSVSPARPIFPFTAWTLTRLPSRQASGSRLRGGSRWPRRQGQTARRADGGQKRLSYVATVSSREDRAARSEARILRPALAIGHGIQRDPDVSRCRSRLIEAEQGPLADGQRARG